MDLINRIDRMEWNIVLIISHLNPLDMNVYCTESLYYCMDLMVGILDSSRDYCLYTVYIIILFYRTSGREEFERVIAERRENFRTQDYRRNLSLLIPDTGEKTWGEKRTFSKVDMVGEITGFRHKIATRRDKHCMNKYLDNVSHNELNVPKFGNRTDYLPAGAPLLDYLTEDVRNSEGWMYPRLEDLVRIYDALRLMFLRIFNEPAPVVVRLDEELNDGVEKTYVEEKNALDRCESETAIRRDRVAWMEEVRTDWNLKERTRWREGLPQLPVWKRRTKPGTKRSRSRSRSRVETKGRNVKKRKLNGKKGNHSVLVPVQLSSVRTENVSRDETDDVQAGGSVAPEKQGDPAVVFRPGVKGSVGSEIRVVPAVISLPGASEVKDAVKSCERGAVEQARAGSVLDQVVMNPGVAPVPVPSPRVRRASSVIRSSRGRRILTYDEQMEDLRKVIEDDEPIGMNGEEFQFEIPAEMEKYDFEF